MAFKTPAACHPFSRAAARPNCDGAKKVLTAGVWSLSSLNLVDICVYMCVCGQGGWVTNAPEVLEQFPDQQVFCSLSENKRVFPVI